MASTKRIAVTTGRVLAGVAGLGVAGLLAVSLGRVDLPRVHAEAPRIDVTPAPADQARVCPGPLLEPGQGQSQAFSPAQMLFSAEAELSSRQLGAPDVLGGDQFGAPTVYGLAAQAGGAGALAAAQSQAAGQPGLGGFAATGCAEPAADAWLVGGSTETGRSALILLSNPSESDATVNLTIYGGEGRLTVPGAAGIVVRAGEQRVLPLAGFAPNLRTPIIRVESRGGHVLASLQSSTVNGLDPAGIELSGTTAPAANTQVLTGVVIPSPPVTPDGDDGYDDRSSAMRLIVPGETDARARVSFINEDENGTHPSPIDVEIQSGLVNEMSIAVLPGGSYTILIEADQPLVAAARINNSAGSDFAWFTSGTALGADGRIAIAPGPGAALHLYNEGADDRTVRLEGGPEGVLEVRVPAGESRVLAVPAGVGYAATGLDTVHATVSYADEGAFASYAIQPASPASSPLTVYPR